MTCGRRDFGLFRREGSCLCLCLLSKKVPPSALARLASPCAWACGTRQPAYLALPGTELVHTRSGLVLVPANMPVRPSVERSVPANSDGQEGWPASSGWLILLSAATSILHCLLRPEPAHFAETWHRVTDRSKTQQVNIPASYSFKCKRRVAR